MSGLDWGALRAGASVALVFAIPFSIAARIVAEGGESSGTAALLSLVAVVGFVLGSGVAAWTQRLELPLKHGLVCAIGTYVVAQSVFIIIRAISGNEIRWFAAFFNLTVVAVAGLIGGALGGALLRRGVFPNVEQELIVSVLVIDVGTSGLRAAVVDGAGAVHALEYRSFPPSTPFPGLVEFDGAGLADAVLEVAITSLAAAGPVDAVGITNQRASTLVWDRATGDPIGPGLGWQDLRTVFDCITAKSEHGLALAPNQSATKVAWLLNNIAGARDRDLCFGTVDTWIAWVLSRGAVHVTDPSNAAVTGLMTADCTAWSTDACAALGVPMEMLPSIVDSTGVFGSADALPGSPPLAALVGDQQASLVGQGCVRPGLAKITFGTGGMLDVCTGSTAPASARRSAHGTFPIVAWSQAGTRTWGAEAIMLSAGTNVEWLRDDLGVIDSAEHSHEVASQCDHTDGVVYVPALMGLGTPHWDYGARGTLLGLTRGSGRPQLVRAVLEGIAHRGADLLEAAEADFGGSIGAIRVDGGMSRNPTFIQALANATGRAIEVSPQTEATTIGAAYLAGLAVGLWGSFDDIAAAWRPHVVVEPTDRLDRTQWADAIRRAQTWIPDLSALDF